MEKGAPDIVGREDELAVIDDVLETVGVPGAAVLLIEGEAGIGKTALCAAAVGRARERGFEALVARAVEAEAGLALAAIGDLLEPVLERVLPALPPPQARAVRVALLLEGDARASDARALAVGVLGALRVLASSAPVLVVVDDVQWLDPSSAGLLHFAARRLEHEPVVCLFSRRNGSGDDFVAALDESRHLPIGALSSGALHRLVRNRLGAVLTRPELRQLHELSAGNPFYALELGRAFQDGAITLTRGEPLPPTLEALVGRRLEGLPAETRDALAVAAALSRPTTAIAPEAVLEPAIAADIVAVEGTALRFTHPLLGAAAYGTLDEERRRALHRRLADEGTSLEERARHLALAATGRDERVARVLEAAAAAARSRAAVTAAAELAERAVALTPDGDADGRHRRALLAARCRFDAGDTRGARLQLERVAAETASGPRHAEAITELARIHMFGGTRRDAVALLRAALAEAGDDPRLRATIDERLVSTLVVLREDLAEAVERARRATETAERLGDPYVLARALAAQGFVGGLVGDPEAPDALERAVDLEQAAGHFYGIERPSFNLAAVHMYRDDLEHARSLFEGLYEEAAERGDEGALAWTADNLAQTAFLAGRWTDALRWADDADETAAQTGQPGQQAYAKGVKALVHAHRGEVAAARALAEAALELSGDEIGIGWMNARWALGALELSLGNAAGAHDELGPLCAHVEREGIGEPGTTRFVFDDVEALVHLGLIDEAERRLTRIEAAAGRLDRAFALAASARCRGLVHAARGDTQAAVDVFEHALASADRGEREFGRARTLLGFGGALRRVKRKREAREALSSAVELFDRCGAAVWAERARDEAARIGGRAPSGGELTPAERKVVELVAQGLPNREVAAALFVTQKTVEFHLRNAFRKLGVRSRAELAHRMH